MILDLQKLPAALLAPAPEGVIVRPVTDEQGIAHFLNLESAIWEESHTAREFLLSGLSDPLQRDLAFVAYSDQKPIGWGGWRRRPQGHLAGSWGGSILPQFRGEGDFLGRSCQHGFNMPDDQIRPVTCVSMRCQRAVRSLKNTDSRD